MKGLIERLEKATGPDRELDCLIFESKHKLLTAAHRGTIDGEPTGQYFGSNGDRLPEEALQYTGSMDAALTLYIKVPERIPTNARLACIEALSQRLAHET